MLRGASVRCFPNAVPGLHTANMPGLGFQFLSASTDPGFYNRRHMRHAYGHGRWACKCRIGLHGYIGSNPNPPVAEKSCQSLLPAHLLFSLCQMLARITCLSSPMSLVRIQPPPCGEVAQLEERGSCLCVTLLAKGISLDSSVVEQRVDNAQALRSNRSPGTSLYPVSSMAEFWSPKPAMAVRVRRGMPRRKDAGEIKRRCFEHRWAATPRGFESLSFRQIFSRSSSIGRAPVYEAGGCGFESCGRGQFQVLFESPLPEGRGFLDTVLGSLRLPVTLCLA